MRRIEYTRLKNEFRQASDMRMAWCQSGGRDPELRPLAAEQDKIRSSGRKHVCRLQPLAWVAQ